MRGSVESHGRLIISQAGRNSRPRNTMKNLLTKTPLPGAFFTLFALISFLVFWSSLVLVGNTAKSLIKVDLNNLSSLFPRHGIQITTTLSFLLFPILASILTVILLTLSRKNKLITLKSLLRFPLYWILFTILAHIVIWWYVQPGCVTGCEGGSGDGEGVMSIIFFLYGFFPWLLVFILGGVYFLKRKVKISERAFKEVKNFTISYFIYMVATIFPAMIFAMMPLLVITVFKIRQSLL